MKSKTEEKFERFLDSVMPLDGWQKKVKGVVVDFETVWDNANKICSEDPEKAHLLRMDLKSRIYSYDLETQYFEKIKGGNKYALYEFPYPLGEKIFESFDDAYYEFKSNDKWFMLVYKDDDILNGEDLFVRNLNNRTNNLGKVECTLLN